MIKIFWLPKGIKVDRLDFRLGQYVGTKVAQIGRLFIGREVTDSTRKSGDR